MMRHIQRTIFIFSLIAIGSTAADAQQPNIFGAILNGIAAGQARKAWDQTDPAIRDCLLARFNVAPAQLAQRGIGPSSPQVVDYVNNCRDIVARQLAEAERAAQAEQERQRAAATAEEQRQRDLAAAQAEQQKEAEENAREEKAAEAAKKAEDVKRHAALVGKYGSKTADAISSHTVLMGMTGDQVIEAMGQPLAKQLVPPSDELWKYQTDQVVLTKDHVSYVGH